MVRSRRNAGRRRRPGAAAVELALLLPLLAFLFVVAVDFARIFYYSLSVTNCARNGAIYACDETAALQSPYKSTEEAALSDASNLSPTPTVVSKSVLDGTTSFVEVTVTYEFQTLTKYPLVPSSVSVARTVRMRSIPAVPKF